MRKETWGNLCRNTTSLAFVVNKYFHVFLHVISKQAAEESKYGKHPRSYSGIRLQDEKNDTKFSIEFSCPPMELLPMVIVSFLR